MKKILVSGCVNCPYLTIWNDGEGNGYDSIMVGDCKHPSFNSQVMHPQMSRNVFLHFGPNDEVDGTKAAGTPEWCPLPDDIKND